MASAATASTSSPGPRRFSGTRSRSHFSFSTSSNSSSLPFASAQLKLSCFSFSRRAAPRVVAIATVASGKVYRPAIWHNVIIKGNNLSQSFFRACRNLEVHCFASKKHGFGPEPVDRKNNNSKIPKENIPVASEPRKLAFGANTRSQSAPVLTTGPDRRSNNVVVDQDFLKKVEAVRRSALEKKKAEEKKSTLEIDYDAPIEPGQSTVGPGTKVAVGIAVVIFGLVFALGDFIPSSRVGPNDDKKILERRLDDKEKEILMARLQQYEATLSSTPNDPTALEGTAVTLAELGEYGRASSILEKLTEERTNDVEGYRLLGEVKYELKDFDGSALAYRSALSLASDDNSFEVLRGLTNSLLAAKKPNEAVQVLLLYREHLNDKSPEDSTLLMDPNVKLEQKMQKVDPVQIDLLLGKAYSDWGHVSDAVAVYDQLISKYPDDFRGYLAKGIILKENGKSGDAERMFIQANFFAPEKAKALVDRYSRQ